MSDGLAVRDWWTRLGLPGLIDIHTHFLPPQVMAKVRAQFDAAGPLIGRPWPLHYRDADDELVETLRSFGIERFTALSYAHKPDMADWLNGWAADFAARVPEALVCGTFFPEESAAAYVEARLDTVEVFKIHVQVGNFSPLHPLLDETWGLIAEAGTPVVLHAGSGPVPAAYTGPGPVAELLVRHPRLRLVIAHMGAPEYRRVPRAGRDERAGAPRHHDGLHRLLLRDGRRLSRPTCCRGCATSDSAARCCSGRTSRTFPYPYRHQLEALERLDLGDDMAARRVPRQRGEASFEHVQKLTYAQRHEASSSPGEPVRSAASCGARSPRPGTTSWCSAGTRDARARRHGTGSWDGGTVGDWAAEIDGADVVVNLAGRIGELPLHRRAPAPR